MSDQPAVAVVVTNHDYGRFVRHAVDSALASQGCTVEVVVVDDGSTDDSLEVLAPYAARGAIRLVCQPNRGQAAAFNAGFAVTTAPVVLFLDADDVLHPHTAVAVARLLDERPDVVRVQFPLRLVDAGGMPLGATVPADPDRLPRGDLRAAIRDHGDDLCWAPTSGNGFRAAALRRIFPLVTAPYRTNADHLLSNLTPLLGEVGVLDDVGGDYRAHGANADHRDHLDLGRVRTIIGCTLATHAETARLAGELGLDGFATEPTAMRSVSFAANRLVSRRLEPAHHPVAGDRVLRLVVAGLLAARRRPDLTLVRRLVVAAWFVVTGIAPRAIAERLATAWLVPAAAPTHRRRPPPDGPWHHLLPVAPPPGATVEDPADLAALADALDPGAVAVVPVDRLRRGGIRRSLPSLTRAARRAGLRVVAAWVPVPSIDQPRRLLPVDHTGALRWYADTIIDGGHRGAQLATIGLRATLRPGAATWWSRLLPGYVVLVERPCTGAPTPGLAVPAAAAAALDDEPAPGTRWAVFAGSLDGGSRTVLLGFPPGAGTPATVVKLASSPAFNADTAAEHERLQALRHELPPDLAGTVPVPLGAGRVGPVTVTAETALRGTSLDRWCGRASTPVHRRIDALDAVTAWLIRYQRPTAARRRWAAADIDPLADRLGALAASGRPGLQTLTATLRLSSAALDGAVLPEVHRHHDLVPCNTLIDRSTVSVIDWEAPPAGRWTRGPALVDLLLFTTFWYPLALGARGPAEEAAAVDRLVRSLTGVTPSADRLRRAAVTAVARYRGELGVDRAFVPILLAHLWVERHDRLATRARRLGVAADAEALARTTAVLDHLGSLAAAVTPVGRIAPPVVVR